MSHFAHVEHFFPIYFHRIVFETLDQLLTVETRPKKKIGFMAKEKQAGYGKHSKTYLTGVPKHN